MARTTPPPADTGEWANKMADAASAIANGIEQPNATPSPVGATAPVPATGKPEPFDWSTLDEPTVLPRKQAWTPAAKDVVSSTPANIRESVENILVANVKRIAQIVASDAKRKRPDYMWVLQRVPDARVAEEFRALVTAYCLHRPGTGDIPFAEAGSPRGRISPRFAEPGWYKTGTLGGMVECAETDDGAVYGVRYSVRPFEPRSPAASE